MPKQASSSYLYYSSARAALKLLEGALPWHLGTGVRVLTHRRCPSVCQLKDGVTSLANA